MSKLINLTIDSKLIAVPEGTLIVDAAKQAGIDIPVFCYHPKLKPAGMCRMCLVEVGRPVIDRATGQPLLQPDGKPQLQFGPKLETSCTTPVSEGMLVVTTSDKVQAARKDVIEFILTSHPLDCPVCDKGGECPLQNLTMAYGPGQSRYLYDEKMHLAKHVPLGELIYLDRERCIQCGRCVRFQSEIAGDPVIGFYHRSRSLEIVTYSDPGFDSYFSGNTTDICPVGALTTADFRFGARPWELNAAASLCPHCPVGCNLTFNVRREAAAGGQVVIKRVMPRQNEAVNEIWICDKGRFAYHYTESQARLTTPLIRKNGQLTPASWDEALGLVADRFRLAGKDLLVLAGGRLPNEDLFNLRRLADGTQGTAALYTHMAGGDLVAKFGATPGTDFGQMGNSKPTEGGRPQDRFAYHGSTILVVASNLHEEAPIWYLRVKQAAALGATLIVANGRPTRLDQYAAHTLRYTYGEEAATVQALDPGRQSSSPELAAASAVLARADNAVILFGSDGLGLEGSQALAQACAGLINATRHAQGTDESTWGALIGVWPHANDQGAWELGLRPLLAANRSPLTKKHAKTDAKDAAGDAHLRWAYRNEKTQVLPKVLYVVAADPFGDDPAEGDILAAACPFIVVQDLFLTATAQQADVVLPAQAFTEREGTFTSGERRVQRFYPAVPARSGCRPDYAITAEIGRRLGLSFESRAPAAVFAQMSAEISAFKDINYRKLAETTVSPPSVDVRAAQWPAIGSSLDRKGLYFSGTGYENKQGLGVQLPLPPAPHKVSPPKVGVPTKPGEKRGEYGGTEGGLLAVPITCLYDRGQTVWPSERLRTRGGDRLGKPWVALNPADAARLGVSQGQPIELGFAADERKGTIKDTVVANLDEGVPAGIVLVPRSFGLAVNEPTQVKLKVSEVDKENRNG
jgi:NADH-quinone oxidoreductase subunit G